MKKIIILLIVALSFASCEKILFKPNTGTDPESVFEEYWTIMKEKYALFDEKGIDWDQKYNEFRPLVNSSTTSEQLFNILGSMSLSLKDGHVVLRDPVAKDNYAYDDYVANFPSNYNSQVLWTYLWNPTYVGFPNDIIFWWNNFEFHNIQYNTLPNQSSIGYISIPSFDIDVADYALESMITSLSNTKGIIIDVRNNTGGDPKIAVKVASYFTNSPVYTGYEKFKTGPLENDFSEDLELTLQPASGGSHYTKPVIILTNRACFSATTLFIQQMDALPHVTFIGDRSGGGGGAVSDGVLANGWKYALSVSQLYDSNGVNVENGREPDIKVDMVAEDEAAFIDTIIERAIEELK